nr:thiol:disulfide interchange protein DsbG [Raoultella sp. NCTC 9187]
MGDYTIRLSKGQSVRAQVLPIAAIGSIIFCTFYIDFTRNNHVKTSAFPESFTLMQLCRRSPCPVKAIEKQGITIIKPFEAPGGVKGWLGKYQDMGVAIYLTPDGKHAISGYMYDENGTNLSEQLFQKELYTPAGQKMWKQMEAASWLLDGKKEAPIILYVFADPFCPYCKQFWQQARPWVESGKVQIRTLLVGVIKPESTPVAAAILASRDPAQTWHDYEKSAGKMKIAIRRTSPRRNYAPSTRTSS